MSPWILPFSNHDVTAGSPQTSDNLLVWDTMDFRGTQFLSDTSWHMRIFLWFWIDIHGQSFEHMVSTLKNKWGLLFFSAKFLNQDITLRKYNIPSNCCFHPLIRKYNNIISKYVVMNHEGNKKAIFCKIRLFSDPPSQWHDSYSCMRAFFLKRWKHKK